MEASSNGHVEIAKLLIDAGANVNNTYWVCSSVLLLYTFCCESNQNGRGPLRKASSKSHVKIAKLLIDAGADVHKTDEVCSSVLLL